MAYTISDEQYENFVAGAVFDFNRYSGYEIDPEIVMDLVKNGPNKRFYNDEIGEFNGYRTKSSYGLDTYPREIILDDIAKKIVGRTWPSYADDEDTKTEFYEKLDKYFGGVAER